MKHVPYTLNLSVRGNPDWRQLGKCREVINAPGFNPDHDPFFPERGGSSKAARAVCATCPLAIRRTCLIWALEHPTETVYGVWGGTSERERRLMRKFNVTYPVFGCGHPKTKVNTYRNGSSDRCATCDDARKAAAA